MKPESYKLFATLAEAYVSEVSSSMDLIKGQPGGAEVIKKLHAETGLGHAQEYKKVDKIAWSELKDAYKGAWVIIQGTKGTGAIQSRGGTYKALASSGGEVREISDGRGGNVLDFLKGEVGKITGYHVGKESGKTGDLKKKRAELNKPPESAVVNRDALIKKFKPLWARAMTAAIADSKGHIANMIKNDAFEKAKKKLNQIESLQNGLEAIEAGNLAEAPESVRNAVSIAISMAASHHYPETTGEIRRARWGSGGYETQHSEGPNQLLQDIAAGDTKKLGTILGFFKRALISGWNSNNY